MKIKFNKGISAVLFQDEPEFQVFTGLKEIYEQAKQEKDWSVSRAESSFGYSLMEYTNGEATILKETKKFKNGEVASVFYRLDFRGTNV